MNLIFTTGINYLAVFVSAIAAMVVGSLWYSPSVFGKQWMAWSGMTMEKMNEAKAKGMTGKYIAAFVGALITSCTIAHIISYADAYSFLRGTFIGVLLAVGIGLPMIMASVLWENKPVKLLVLNTFQYIVSFGIMGAILGVWK